MQRDQAGLCRRLPQILGHGAQDERVADPVEAILAQPVRLGDLLVDGVCFDMCGERLVERGVEVGDASDAWEFFLAEADDLQCGEIVAAVRNFLSAGIRSELDLKGSYSGARSSNSSRRCSVSSLISTGSP